MALVVIHILFVLKMYNGRFRERNASLVGSIGTILMVLFISIVCNLLAPFQCLEHPNKHFALRTYPTVLCFNSNMHKQMIVVSLVADLIPIVFFTFCVYVVWETPARMRKGDAHFAHAVAFLFVRFKTDRYWFVLVFLIRNTMFSIAPVFTSVVTQILMMSFCMQLSLMALVFFWPYRVRFSNELEIVANMVVIFVLSVSPFYVENGNVLTVSKICIAFAFVALAGIIVAVGSGLSMRFGRFKPYQFFICHHKAGAGGFARLLKICLLESRCVTRKVFIDSDDLTDLDKLFSFVQNETQTLVVLLTQELFARPWCVGELVTCHMNRVRVAPVAFPDFVVPEVDMLELAHTKVLMEHCITTQMVQDMWHWLMNGNHGQTTLPETIGQSVLDTLVRRLVASELRAETLIANISRTGNELTQAEVVIVTDNANMESIAAAWILFKLMVPLTLHLPLLRPHVLSCIEVLPNATTKLILILTNGCLQSKRLLKTLLRASYLEAAVLPVISEESFRFPTADFYRDLRESSAMNRISSSDGDSAAALSARLVDASVLHETIKAIFVEIAITFNTHDTEAIIKTRAQMVVDRIIKMERHTPHACSSLPRCRKTVQQHRYSI